MLLFIYIMHLYLNVNVYFLLCGFPGIFTRNLRSAILIVPRKVNHLGEHLSYNLTQHHTHNYYDDNLSDLNDHLVHYQIDFLNKTMHLEME